MALTDEGNGMVMPVAPMYGGGYGNGGFGNFDGDWGWIVLLLLLAGGGGWGLGGFGGFGGMMGMGMMDGMMLYPWMNQAEITTNGFQNQAISGQLNSIQSGVQNLATQFCNCCGDMQMSIANGFAGVEQGANARQIANMQTAFAQQTAMSQGFNDVGLQLCQASGDNRLATANLGADIAREACATRTSDTQNTQVILNAINDGFRLMSDQRYQDKIDAKNDEIAQLRQENLYARGQASQIAQNQTIVDNIYNRLDTCPVGTTPVYGRTPIFTCNNGCGCGNNNFIN